MKETRHYLIVWESDTFRADMYNATHIHNTPCDIINEELNAAYILDVFHNKIAEVVKKKNERYKEKSENSYMRLNKIVNIIKL